MNTPRHRSDSRRPRKIRALLAALTLALTLGANSLSAQTGKKYALLIGLNEYLRLGSGVTELQFAVNDVEALEEKLDESGFDEVTVLTNERAVRSNIVAHLYRYAKKTEEQDTFVLFFAGHGVRNEVFNQATYWLTNDASLDPLDAAGIRLSHLLDFVSDIKAEKKLLLLDHCFSGEVTKATETGEDGVRDGSGSGNQINTRGSFRANDFRTELEQRASGMVVLAAAREGAQESASLKSVDRDGNERSGHGLFTYTLLQALGTRQADAGTTNNPPDGRLTLAELVTWATANIGTIAAEHGLAVQELTEVSQGENLSSWELVSSLPIDDLQERIDSAANYRQKLLDWEDRGLIDFETRIECFRVLKSWQEALADGPPLFPEDETILDECRQHLDSSAPEDLLGPDLVAEIARLKGSE